MPLPLIIFAVVVGLIFCYEIAQVIRHEYHRATRYFDRVLGPPPPPSP